MVGSIGMPSELVLEVLASGEAVGNGPSQSRREDLIDLQIRE